ncbi:tripartite tricarboxylate transporter permease [uncultured Dysosmobacter sp.]|uniref:tripartite tricarboxylate transporter permease n=1 Tax=uncultured Dysosmobacter sp. TaxID=2591384 RepID=UPI0026069A20|nr:tripartite tricarboxylate transporter permease [uncultured Dysosmobacter sp.]
MEQILEVLPLVFNVQTIIGMFFGNIVGLLFGAIPGFTGVMAIAILLPFTFALDPATGIVTLFSCFAGGCFGGSISAILIGTPGAPEAAATVRDGYPLALKGESYKALSMAVFASCVGGTVSAVLLMFLAPVIADWTLNFAPPEYFVLGIFGISVIAGLNSGNLIMGIVAGLLGIFLSMVGMDAQSGVQRFTFGSLRLYSGFNLTPIILSFFALNRIFIGFEHKHPENSKEKGQAVVLSKEKLSLKDYKDCSGAICRGTIVGSIIGAIPAAGAAIAAFISYNIEKTFSKKRDLLGTGILEGVVAPEAANNAVTGTSLIPLLTLGIPGSGGASAMLGAFMMHGLAPGPFLFRDNGATMYAIMIGFIVTNIILLLVVRFLSKGFIHITRVPEAALITVLFVICLVGAYSNSTSWFDVMVTVIVGIAAYFLSKLNVPTVPFILGFILGPTIESNFRKALIMSNNDLSIFVTRPICIVLIILTIVMLVGAKFMNRAGAK